PNRAMMETGVVAGARGDGNGWSTMIPGDDDGTVTVASTRLPGSADFATVRCLHLFLPFWPPALAYTRRFLDHGYFHTEADRRPIPAAS
ncbi:MAG: hypothetical protein ACRC1K_21010, partial [Planctomycetia bacterium]